MKYISIALITIVLVSGCTTNPSECPLKGYAIDGQIDKKIVNNMQALEELKKYFESENPVFYRVIKNLSPNQVILKNITVSNNYIESWIVSESYGIDKDGVVYIRRGCA